MTTPTSNSCCEKCAKNVRDRSFIGPFHQPMTGVHVECRNPQCECHQESKCCGFCAGIEGQLVDGVKACRNSRCECHTTEKNSGWREDIKDEGWYKSGVLDTWDEGEVRLLFSFITQVEKEAEERVAANYRGNAERAGWEKGRAQTISILKKFVEGKKIEIVDNWKYTHDRDEEQFDPAALAHNSIINKILTELNRLGEGI